MKHLHFRDTFNPKHYRDLNEYQKKGILESHTFLKEYRYGTIKGRTVIGGDKQRDFITKEDSTSPTVSNKAVLFSCFVDEKEKSYVAVIDILNKFIQTRIENENEMAIINIIGVLVELILNIYPEFYGPFVTTDKKGEKVIIVQCTNGIY